MRDVWRREPGVGPLLRAVRLRVGCRLRQLRCHAEFGFRGFEKQTQRSLIIIGFAIAFILLACLVFLRWSLLK